MSDVALKEYLERCILELDRRVDQRLIDTDRNYQQHFAAAEEALRKADAALREYKAGSNEWRDALKDQAARLATREELGKVDDAVQELQRAKANVDGRNVVISSGLSVAIMLLLWALSRWVP